MYLLLRPFLRRRLSFGVEDVYCTGIDEKRLQLVCAVTSSEEKLELSDLTVLDHHSIDNCFTGTYIHCYAIATDSEGPREGFDSLELSSHGDFNLTSYQSDTGESMEFNRCLMYLGMIEHGAVCTYRLCGSGSNDPSLTGVIAFNRRDDYSEDGGTASLNIAELGGTSFLGGQTCNMTTLTRSYGWDNEKQEDAMKRWIALCLSLLLLAVLTACGQVSDMEQETEEGSGAAEIGIGAKTDLDTVTVSTAAELLAAIAPGVHIILAPGTYNFSDLTEEEIAGCSDYVNQDYLLSYENFLISDVTGLTLEAAEGGTVELVTENGGASVLDIWKSGDVTLRGLTFGHAVERGECNGSVLCAEDCKNLTIENCRLYGCGTDGICTQRVEGLTVTGTEIYKCSESVFALGESTTGAVFDRCRFYGNYSSILFYFSDGADVLVKDTEIYDNQGDLMPDYTEHGEDTDNRHIIFRNCIFRDNRRIDTLSAPWPCATFEDCEFSCVSVFPPAGTPYEELVERFYTLVSDPYGFVDIAEYGELGVIESARAMEYNALEGLGYTIEDISGDGIPELVVGTLPEHGGQINAVYTLVDSQPQFVFEGWYRSSYSYLGNGRFYYYGSSSASEAGQGFFSLSKDGTTLNCEDFYFTHAAEEDYSYLRVYYNTTGSWDIAESQKADMSLEEFWAYEPSYEDLPLTSFADYAAEQGPEAPVQVHWTELWLRGITDYEKFVADDGEYATDILFTTKRTVTDFELMRLTIRGCMAMERFPMPLSRSIP